MYGIFFLKTNNNKEIHKQIIFISSLFILYLLISSNPFQKIELDTTLEGLGLNPILQHLLFIIHPPTLFLGYIGLIIPFVLASHILISKNFSISFLFSFVLSTRPIFSETPLIQNLSNS